MFQTHRQTIKRWFLAASFAVGVVGFFSVPGLCPLALSAETLQQLTVNPHRHLITATLSKAVSSTVHHRVHDGRLQVIWDLEGADVSSSLKRKSAWLEDLKRQWPDLISASVSRFSGPVLRFRFEFQGEGLMDPVVMHHDTNTPYLAFSTQTSPRLSSAPTALLMTASKHSGSPHSRSETRPKTLSETMSRLHDNNQPMKRYQTFSAPPQSSQLMENRATSYRSPYSELHQLDQQEPEYQLPERQHDSHQVALQQQVNELSKKAAYWQEKFQTVSRQQAQSPDREKRAFKLGLQLNKTRETLVGLQEKNRELNQQLKSVMAAQTKQTQTMGQTYAEQKRLTQLQEENERLAGQIRQLKQQNNHINRHSDEPVTALALASVPSTSGDTEQFQALKQALKQSKQSLLKSIQTINRQNQAIARLNEQLVDVKEGIGQASLEQQTYLNDQLTKAESKQDELEKSVQRLELENRSLKLVVNGLQKKLPNGATQDILSQGGLPDIPIEDEGGVAWTSKHVEHAEQQVQLEKSTRLNLGQAVYTAEPSS